MPHFITSVFDLEKLPDSQKPHVALVGRSNVGKSSLVNALGGQSNLARVSREPGRTKTLNFYELDRSYFLVDLPGYGFARGRKGRREEFTKLITDYLQETANLCMIFVVIDSRVGATELDKNMLAFLKEAKLPHAIIASKIDKLSASELSKFKKDFQKEYPETPLHFHSVKESKGRGEIRRAIEMAVKGASKDKSYLHLR